MDSNLPEDLPAETAGERLIEKPVVGFGRADDDFLYRRTARAGYDFVDFLERLEGIQMGMGVYIFHCGNRECNLS